MSTRAEIRAEVLTVLLRRDVPLTTGELANALDRHVVDVYHACRVLFELGTLDKYVAGSGSRAVLWSVRSERAHA